jgi:EAL domain-containing protein (putative c-di-GMP-specific phosphodiesterase class I)
MEANEKWQSIFGRAWDLVLDANKTIGGYYLNHAEKSVILDKNIKVLLGIIDENNYDEVNQIVNYIKEDGKFNTPILIHEIEGLEDNVSAGIIEVEVTYDKNSTELFELNSHNQLIQALKNDRGRGMLCLARLENIPQNNYAEWYINSAINTLAENLPDGSLIVNNSKHVFWVFVPDCPDEKSESDMIERMNNAVKYCSVYDEFGLEISGHHGMLLTIGTAAHEGNPTHRMHTGNFSLYEAISGGVGACYIFHSEEYMNQSSGYMGMKRFIMLMEENRFIYHFQPIVKVETGEVVAYEALMRTDDTIGFNPIQILKFAEQTNRLYDVEYATMFNTMKFINEHQEAFENRKLFINTITGHSLTDADYKLLCDTYGSLMEKTVIEFTENSEISDEELEKLQKRFKASNIQIAVDDYGTGYSNTTNLLRYNPAIVKLDRSLITDIDSNLRTRKIVESTIASLHESGFLALAEGVETKEELQTVISLGADYIQGYYTSRPKPVLLYEISSIIRDEIAEFREQIGEGALKVYKPKEGEIIDLTELVEKKYTDIVVDCRNIAITGAPGHVYTIPVMIKDGTECNITLRNAGINSVTEFGAIRLGNECDVTLSCEGSNVIRGKGIFVPKSSSLLVTGIGDLDITAEMLCAYGIGTGSDESHGNITIDLSGKLNILVNGDTAVGIGGGKSGENAKIQLLAGNVTINSSGRKCLGIGNFIGKADITLTNLELHLQTSTPESVGVGMFAGELNLLMRDFSCYVECAGHTGIGIGVLEGGYGKIDIAHGKIIQSLRGRKLTCIGTKEGALDISVVQCKVMLNCEGNDVEGIGDSHGAGNLFLKFDELDMVFVTGRYEFVSAGMGKCIYEGGTQNFAANQ